MTAMVSRFVTAGAEFLARLLAAVRKKAPDIQDDELAAAIVASTRKNQYSEALWLETVPTAIENVRSQNRRASVQRAQQQKNDLARLRKQAETDPEVAAYLKELEDAPGD